MGYLANIVVGALITVAGYAFSSVSTVIEETISGAYPGGGAPVNEGLIQMGGTAVMGLGGLVIAVGLLQFIIHLVRDRGEGEQQPPQDRPQGQPGPQRPDNRPREYDDQGQPRRRPAGQQPRDQEPAQGSGPRQGGQQDASAQGRSDTAAGPGQPGQGDRAGFRERPDVDEQDGRRSRRRDGR